MGYIGRDTKTSIKWGGDVLENLGMENVWKGALSNSNYRKYEISIHQSPLYIEWDRLRRQYEYAPLFF